MEPKPPTGFETQKDTPEKVMIIGREMPMARDMYESLSETRDILVYSEAASTHRTGQEVKTVSERELFDDLLEFCANCRDLPTEESDDAFGYGRAIRHIDTFLDTMTYLSKEMYGEAVKGLAARHGEWLARRPEANLLFVVPDNRAQKSQNAVTRDIVDQVDETVTDRARLVSLSDIQPDSIGPDTKLVLSDDWSVMGNHVANDLANVLKLLHHRGIDTTALPVEINFLLARKDQVEEGIHTIERMKEDVPELMTVEPTLVAYFEAPVIKQGYDDTASPTGSHSAVDYGFSTTLERMLTVASRHNKASRMPYIAMIIPTYGYDYNDKHIDK